MRQQTELAEISKVSTAISQMTDLNDVTEVIRKAKTLRTYFAQIPDKIRYANEAHTIELKAERRGGELLIDLKKIGLLGVGQPLKKKVLGSKNRILLRDFSLTQNDSRYYQKLAKIPEPEWNELLSDVERLRRIGNGLIQQ